MGVTGNAIWECDAFGTFLRAGRQPPFIGRQSTTAPVAVAAARPGGGAYGTPEYTPFTSAHLINFEWLQHDAGENQIFPALADLKDAAGAR